MKRGCFLQSHNENLILMVVWYLRRRLYETIGFMVSVKVSKRYWMKCQDVFFTNIGFSRYLVNYIVCQLAWLCFHFKMGIWYMCRIHYLNREILESTKVCWAKLKKCADRFFIWNYNNFYGLSYNSLYSIRMLQWMTYMSERILMFHRKYI